MQSKNKPTMVFVATRVPYPPVTGHYLRTLNILRGLARHFEVHFFGFRDKDHDSAQHAAANEVLREFCATVHIEQVRAERSKAWLLIDLVTSLLTFVPYTATKYRSRSMHRVIRATLASGTVTVAHADSLQSGQYLEGTAVPKLLTNHNVEYRRLLSHAAQQRFVPYRLALKIQGWLTLRYEQRTVRSIGNCVVVSESDRDEIARLVPGTRLFLVRNGADTSLPALAPADPAALAALWVGGMNDPFNREGVLHFASRVLPHILKRLPAFRWRIVGRDPPAMLRALAEDQSSGVELAGYVPNLRDAYERSAIAVVPLLSGGGTKLKVLEAMAMGRAVVTTSVGAEGIGARAGVEMEIAETDRDFAEKVCSLLSDPERRNRMAAAARALAEREFGWDVVNRQMLSAVETVIKPASRHEPAATCAG